jgi:hypothetical protein
VVGDGRTGESGRRGAKKGGRPQRWGNRRREERRGATKGEAGAYVTGRNAGAMTTGEEGIFYPPKAANAVPVCW